MLCTHLSAVQALRTEFSFFIDFKPCDRFDKKKKVLYTESSDVHHIYEVVCSGSEHDVVMFNLSAQILNRENSLVITFVMPLPGGKRLV